MHGKNRITSKTLPEIRRKKIKQLLEKKQKIRLIEAHNGISAKIACGHFSESNNGVSFDGIWVSSLTSSASKGLPDIELDYLIKRVDTIEEVLMSSDLPVIVDVDTGGHSENFSFLCSRLEALGVSGVILEDKCGVKQNSLLEDTKHSLEDPNLICQKINFAKDNSLTKDFLIFARIESLIANLGVEDAIKRAEIYCDSLADGIVIHSNKKEPNEVYKFASLYDKIPNKKPLVCIPTTYNTVTAQELFSKNFDIVIYANHLFRASVNGMIDAYNSILKEDKSQEADELYCYPVKSILEML